MDRKERTKHYVNEVYFDDVSREREREKTTARVNCDLSLQDQTKQDRKREKKGGPFFFCCLLPSSSREEEERDEDED
jgi:hypothetical protein